MDALLISIVRKVNVHPCSHILKLNSLHKSPSPLGYFLMGYFLTSLSLLSIKGAKWTSSHVQLSLNLRHFYPFLSCYHCNDAKKRRVLCSLNYYYYYYFFITLHPSAYTFWWWRDLDWLDNFVLFWVICLD